MKRNLLRLLGFVAICVASWIAYSFPLSQPKEDDFVPTVIVGVHHLGHAYSISNFYVDKYSGFDVGREGGGGGSVCCIMIPVRWRPGLAVEVRWEVADWSRENRKEIEAGNYKSVSREGIYIAKVPLEKYERPGSLYVHFFSHGRVRVVSTMQAPSSSLHPVHGPADGGELATKGLLVKEMFTQAELQETDKRGSTWK